MMHNHKGMLNYLLKFENLQTRIRIFFLLQFFTLSLMVKCGWQLMEKKKFVKFKFSQTKLLMVVYISFSCEKISETTNRFGYIFGLWRYIIVIMQIHLVRIKKNENKFKTMFMLMSILLLLWFSIYR